MKRSLLLRSLMLCATAPSWLPAVARAQDAPRELITPGSLAEERLRERQLLGASSPAGFLIRSSSSLWESGADSTATSALRLSVLPPQAAWVRNSLLPQSMNDGPLWAGRGDNLLASAGVGASWAGFTVILVPEYVSVQNRPYPAPDSVLFPPYHELANPVLFPPIPGRSPFSSPFHGPPQSIDLPIRFGDRSIRQWRWGQSTIMATRRGVRLGVSSENQWWGPGLKNALVLSNHAAGFPHAFLRTARPVATRVGSFDARWLVGRLRESPFFTDDPADEFRSISALALGWTPVWEPGLSIGAARAVLSPIASGAPRRVLGNAFSVLADVGQPNAYPLTDRAMRPGRDQVTSLWARWVFPADGLEAWGEWGRAELPKSLRDFLEHPNHTQGYTLGLRWLGSPLWRQGRVTVEGESSWLEQGTTYRYRPLGSWYTSRAVSHGFTHEGQVLGAAIGPGSSSQWLSAGWLAPQWGLSATLLRIRAMEDVPSQRIFQGVDPRQNWCRHDVSLLPGVKGIARTRWGGMSASYTSGYRVNTFFENRSPACPFYLGRDIRNQSLRVTFEPASVNVLRAVRPASATLR